MKFKANFHDLQLSDWGPYSKKYKGISHIANNDLGLRFDLSVFPGMYRRKVELPNAMYETNYHIRETSPNYEYFSTRHEIEWKDEVFCDVSHSKIDDDAYLISADFVNNTDSKHNLVLHYMASVHYPLLNAKYNEEFVHPISYELPQKSELIHALDYKEFCRSVIRPTDSLVADGLRRGEVRKKGYHKGSAVLIGEKDGDVLHFLFENSKEYENPVIFVRCHANKEGVLTFCGAINGKIAVAPSDDIQLFGAPITLSGEKDFTLRASDSEILLDCLIVCESNDADFINIKEEALGHEPLGYEMGSAKPTDLSHHIPLDLATENAPTTSENNILVLKYRDSDYYYGVCWDFLHFNLRYLLNDELDSYLKVMSSEHVSKILFGNKKGTFANIFCRPIPMEPHSQRTVYGAVCAGKSKEEVEQKLRSILNNKKEFRTIKQERQKAALQTSPTANGKRFKFSQDIMTATTLVNTVYPIYTKRSYIRHNTPGTWWDSLYTWDSGFCGLGLATCDIQRAVDCLNAYVTEVGDEENAFIHHGTPLPIQFYLLQEIYNRTQSKELLAFFYPRLKQYYLFMIGKLASSDTARFNSGLLNTWSYFYNSAGWDDYPPQYYVHINKLTEKVCCVSTTSHMIRCAKILKTVARLLNINDISEYCDDIDRMTTAIQTHTWDEESGYFGYLLHDDNYNPLEIMRYKNGENFNKGLDGTSPMIAGILTENQRDKIVANLSDTKHILTDIGLSTVDKSAGYYRKDGYWNGAVWMPHQWFYFKATLDYGYTDIAFKIADTGLKTWEKEVGESYNCFEHFIVDSGRGAGWHHFSGLSTPVLLWYQAYYKLGQVTCGFDGVITEYNFSGTALECSILYSDRHVNTSCIIVMPPDKKYTTFLNGEEIKHVERMTGVIELSFAVDAQQSIAITVKPQQ